MFCVWPSKQTSPSEVDVEQIGSQATRAGHHDVRFRFQQMEIELVERDGPTATGNQLVGPWVYWPNIEWICLTRSKSSTKKTPSTSSSSRNLASRSSWVNWPGNELPLVLDLQYKKCTNNLCSTYRNILNGQTNIWGEVVDYFHCHIHSCHEYARTQQWQLMFFASFYLVFCCYCSCNCPWKQNDTMIWINNS